MQPLTLQDFDLPAGQNYHIYRISNSRVAQQPHSHDYYQLCYVQCGQIRHGHAEEPVTLQAGDAFLVPPGFVHCVEFGHSARIYSLSFTEDVFHAGFSHSNVYRFMTALKLETMDAAKLDVRLRIPLDNTRRNNLQALLDCLIAEDAAGCPRELAAAASLIAAALCVVSQGYFAQPDGPAQLQKVEACQRAMAECIAYIDANYTKDLTLQGLSRQFALSRSRFGILFPQYTGTTLKPYIAQKRIAHAVMLLQSTKLPVAQIGQTVGYEDITTFYRNFTKVTGVTPTAYRPEEI